MNTVRGFWLRWTLACAAGEILGIAAAGGIAGAVLLTVGEPEGWPTRVANLAVMLLAGALEGYLVGLFQWRVLRERFAVPGRAWVGATVTVAVLGWLLGMMPSTLAPDPSSGAAVFDPGPAETALLALAFGLGAGLLFGAAQWLVLRRYAEGAWAWIPANALGWGVALVWIYLVASFPPQDIALWQLVVWSGMGGLLSGLSIGGVTGWFLLRMSPVKR